MQKTQNDNTNRGHVQQRKFFSAKKLSLNIEFIKPYQDTSRFKRTLITDNKNKRYVSIGFICIKIIEIIMKTLMLMIIQIKWTNSFKTPLSNTGIKRNKKMGSLIY